MRIGCHSSPPFDASQWNSIWSLAAPASVSHFIWHACHSILPTRKNQLKRKGIDMDQCPVCSNTSETIIHTLWECLGASDVWGEALSPLKKWSSYFAEYRILWSHMFSELPPQELAVSAIILCNIWF